MTPVASLAPAPFASVTTMTRKALYVWIGFGLLLVGGAIVAFVDSTDGAAVGSTIGLAGLVLAGWAWFTDSTPPRT
jgi:hypothetical protein